MQSNQPNCGTGGGPGKVVLLKALNAQVESFRIGVESIGSTCRGMHHDTLMSITKAVPEAKKKKVLAAFVASLEGIEGFPIGSPREMLHDFAKLVV